MTGPKIIDISPVISPRIGVFPGDVAFERTVGLDFNHGHNLTLSSIRTTLHLGAHADGPIHYQRGAGGIGERDLNTYLGPVLVLHAQGLKSGERAGLKHLPTKWQSADAWPTPRILLATGSFPDPDHWNSDFCSLAPELIERWGKAGIKLIGLDTPSIDPEDSKELPSHAIVAKYDMAILEGLMLSHVPEGVYTLVALPLKIYGADASPVRAVLLSDN